VMSGGRLEIAFPLGTGMEYWSNSVVNPANARAQFRESIDIMIQAWTAEGPTTYDGEFYNYRYLNVWPRPYQQPYPRCYIVGTGSPETIAFAAGRGWGYASVFVPITQQVKTFRAMRETMAQHGHQMTPDKAMANTIVYVAETDEIAEKEVVEHIRYYFSVAARTTPRYLAPPGYISLDQFRVRAGAATKMHGGFDWDEMTRNWRVAVGTPERVAEKIARWCEEADSSRVICHHHIGDMPHWKVVKNMTMFAEEVIPRLRPDAPKKPHNQG
jgi:alkanesulfonate monooxygenase SsuD/methylene tetrahydromethanopterin reductase-like flavin-dependent oxidoreductase (luciferase family)